MRPPGLINNSNKILSPNVKPGGALIQKAESNHLRVQSAHSPSKALNQQKPVKSSRETASTKATPQESEAETPSSSSKNERNNVNRNDLNNGKFDILKHH